MEEPGRLQSMGSLGVGHDWATWLSLSLSCTGEENGNPLQCSCLENPRDGGAWWATVYGLHRVRHDWSDLAAAAAAFSWQIDEETMETVTDLIFLDSKITADGNCSHEIKRRLLLGRKAMTNLESIVKSRDITFPTKVHPVKAMVFPVVMYGCESWTIKKAEHRRVDAFELWCWRTLLRVPWTARRSNQSILKEISPGC